MKPKQVGGQEKVCVKYCERCYFLSDQDSNSVFVLQKTRAQATGKCF